MPDQPACTVTAYQQVCVDADVMITATATPGTPTVTCLAAPVVNPFGTVTCAPTGIPCGFSVQVTLCVAVPVAFGATAATTGITQQCLTPSTTTCVPTP